MSTKKKTAAKTTTDKKETMHAYALYDGVIGFKLLQSLRPNAQPEDNLFFENHRDRMKELLREAGLRTNAEGVSLETERV
jgi:hypothetical protein